MNRKKHKVHLKKLRQREVKSEGVVATDDLRSKLLRQPASRGEVTEGEAWCE